MSARHASGLTWKQVAKRCPFRTAFGPEPGARTPLEMVAAASRTIAILGGEPTPLEPEVARELTEVLAGGGTVLLLADRADLRDAAKAEIVRLCTLARMPAGGRG